jgi:hypothetical protein
MDNMGEEAASIFGGVMMKTPKLVGMEDSILSCLKLQPVGEHFPQHFVQSFQKNYWAK